MTNEERKQRAAAVIPSGVNSPVRAFKSVGGEPLFVERAEGAHLYTCDGRKLIDYCISFGPLILGHAHPAVVSAICETAKRGTSFAVTTDLEIEMAELITGAIAAVDKVRLVNSGTEAVMTGLRLARGATGRSKILKFSGCYHGHVDSMLVEAGSGVAGIAAASSAGVTKQAADNTLIARYNHLEDVKELVETHGDDLAAIVVEPIAANMGLVLPDEGFLQALRELADSCGALLIFDEVITGFRMTFGAYSDVCGIRPDLTCLGKIIGGGMPIGAIGGRADLMDQLAPEGPVYQAGTLSGNPVSVAAGLATLRTLRDEDPYPHLQQRTETLVAAIKASAEKHGRVLQVSTIGNTFSAFFNDLLPREFSEVAASDQPAFVKLFHSLLKSGVYVPPSAFETSFLSMAHSDSIVDETAAAWDKALR
jgi:glutamate-1-semialdehyde 2,1-aminomutase